MKYGKIIDGELTLLPHMIVLDGMQIFNPTPPHAVAAGYKEVVETAMPEEPAPEGQHWESTWKENPENISQEWILVDDEETPSQPPAIEERVENLEASTSMLTGAVLEMSELVYQ